MAWPLQSQCNSFYGNPSGANGGPSPSWERANLVMVRVPWPIVTSWSGAPMQGIRVHKLVAGSLSNVLDAIWDRFGNDLAAIQRAGMHLVGGGYNYRLMRGGNRLSMHSWGCAVDFDPARNGLGDQTPAMDMRVVEEFERAGWEWGGRWRTKDGMHFQAARTGKAPSNVATLLDASPTGDAPASEGEAIPPDEVLEVAREKLADERTSDTVADVAPKSAIVRQNLKDRLLAKIGVGGLGVYTLSEVSDNVNQASGLLDPIRRIFNAVPWWLWVGLAAAGLIYYWVSANFTIRKRVEMHKSGEAL